MKVLKRALWIGVPVLGLVALWYWSATRPVEVDVAEVVRGPVRSFVEEEGRTRVRERYVVSAAVAGRLLRIDLEEGDAVGAEDVVARLDPLPIAKAIEQVEAQIRALREQIAGVETKKPKPEEIARARVQEDQAAEALEVAEHELDRARASWERLRKELARIRTLAEQQLVPVSELDEVVAAEAEAEEQVRAQEVRVRIARMAIAATRLGREVLEARTRDFDWEAKALEAQIAAHEATLAKLRDDLARTVVRAPVGGTVLRLFQESEQVVQPGTPLLEIGDLDTLEVEADFLSEDVARMRRGMPAEVFGRALGDEVIAGEIDRIHPSAFEEISSLGVEQQRVTVVVAFDAESSGLGDRFRVEVRVVFETREKATLVPEGALFRTKGGWHAFLVRDGRARLVEVRTGLRDGRVREVVEGLEPGDTVILHPDDAVEDGARVEPLPAGA